MTALDLLATLQARGVELVAAGDRLRWRPREALTPVEVERLRDHKAQLLRLLAEPKTADSPAPPLRLDSVTVREVLGPTPTPEVLQQVESEILAALAGLDQEIRSGQLGPGPMLVRGIPLALWLPLDQVARLLGTYRPRREAS